jgi:outer membrane protein OmpU
MKKVLFATTALIALGSMAAADVRLSGYGRFGLDYNDLNDSATPANGGNGVSSTTITSRLRIQFDMSTETDGGVGFNARVRMQGESRDNNAGVMGLNGARFGVTYGGLLVNVGNIIGAVENAPGLYTTGTRSAGTGIDGMGFNSLPIIGASWDAYSSAGVGANGVEALYTVGGFTGHISFSQQNETFAANNNGGEERAAIMLTYSFGDYYVTGAYQSSTGGPTSSNATGAEELNDGLYFVAAGADWGQFGAKLAYGSTAATDAVTLEGNMDIGAASNILVWVNNASTNNLTTRGPAATRTTIGRDGTSWGINYQYDLGGGSTFVAGYVDSERGVNAGSQKQFQAGVYFSF